jgi:putative DNA primase/helicase
MGEVVHPFGDKARPGSGGPSPEDLARFPLNDIGNAMRLILLAGGSVALTGEVGCESATLLHVLGLGWVGFNGKYWDTEFGEDLARKLAHQVAHRLPSLWAIYNEQGTTPKEFWRFATDSGSAGKTSAMLTQAKSYMTVKIDAFDVDPYALNCTNGTVKMRFEDGKFIVDLHDHSAADRITKCARVPYDPKAKAPLYRMVWTQSLPDEAERGAFHRAMGYSSTGAIHEQGFFMCQGHGQDGKSTLLDACRETMGTYAAVAKPETFIETGQVSGSGPTPDLIKLSGDVRMAIVSEPPRGAALKEGLIKAWTGGSKFDARDLHAKSIEFRPRAKLIWEMNPWVKIKGDDDGIWRRIYPILFRRKVPKAEIDRMLPEKLKDEGSGILNWLIEGVGDWLTRGELAWPDSLHDVVDNLRKASSPFGDWLSERCHVREAAKGERVLVAELYSDFKIWCEGQGIDRVMSAKAFGDAMTDRQIVVMGKDRRGCKYRGPIRLKTPGEMDAEGLDAPPQGRGPDSAGGASANGYAAASGGELEWDDDQ